VIGFGRIRGRRVFVTADDFSVRGGHADGGISGKAAYGEVRSITLGHFLYHVLMMACLEPCTKIPRSTCTYIYGRVGMILTCGTRGEGTTSRWVKWWWERCYL
jgi:hypothetical protein